MDYKVSDNLKCPDCNSLMTFYDEDCLNGYYHCQNCGYDIENDSLDENTRKFAKNCHNLSNYSYEANQGHIWIDFEDAVKNTQLKRESILSLVQDKKIPSRLLIDWIPLNKYNGISVKEMALKMKKSENTITKQLRLGILKGIKIGGKWVIYPQ
jgi:hypothetical protein